MAMRIEQSTLTTTPTDNPLIVRVDADVTQDDATVLNPKIYHVSVLWNTTTPRADLKEAIRKAIKEDSLQADLRAALGEAVIPAPQAPAPGVTNVTITAQNVTVTQAPPGGT